MQGQANTYNDGVDIWMVQHLSDSQFYNYRLSIITSHTDTVIIITVHNWNLLTGWTHEYQMLESPKSNCTMHVHVAILML